MISVAEELDSFLHLSQSRDTAEDYEGYKLTMLRKEIFLINVGVFGCLGFGLTFWVGGGFLAWLGLAIFSEEYAATGLHIL